MQKQLSYWQGNCVLPLADIYIYLFVETIIYFVIAIILDRILVHETGVASLFQLIYHLMPFKTRKVRFLTYLLVHMLRN